MTNYRDAAVAPIPPSMRALLLVALIVTVVACGGARSSHAYAFRTAPNPNGCYAEVFSDESFKGDGDYVNGPARYPRVSDLREGHRWPGGIRSVRTGPTTSVVLWSNESYRGASMTIGPDQRHPRISAALPAAAASLQISCN